MMRIIETVAEMQAATRRMQREGERLAFVPTMGFLHEGHLSLIRLASQQADRGVVSIFVNPTQFGPNEDFDRYPRDMNRDVALCREPGVDVIFFPLVAEMYASDRSVYVDEGNVTKLFEGSFRPTHFCGVLTVVAKLFLAVQPDIAVFGEKDAQQLWLIRRMVRDLNFPIEIVAGPTLREPDGLAMSSRNVYLSEAHRREAAALHRALVEAQRLHDAGERDAGVLREAGATVLERDAPSGKPDYVEVVDDAFQPAMRLDGSGRMIMAVRFGATRLIDNMPLG